MGLHKKDYETAISHLERAYTLSGDEQEKLIALQSLRAAYKKAGMIDKAKTVELILRNMREKLDSSGAAGHSHGGE